MATMQRRRVQESKDMSSKTHKKEGKHKSMIPAWLDVGIWFIIWYLSSVVCNNFSKELVGILGSGRILTLFQLISSSILAGTLLLSGIGGFQIKSCKGIQKKMFLLAAFFSAGFLCLNVGMQYMHVSMAMVLRATEPLFAVFILILRGGAVEISVIGTLVMIVFGAALSAFQEPKFSILGLVFLAGSNVCFSFRSIIAKAIKDKESSMDNVNIFFHCSWRGALIQAVVVSIFDFESVLNVVRVIMGEIQISSDFDRFPMLMTINGIAYFTYLQASFIVLSRVGVVSHTVGNSLRRPVCILCAVLYFGNTVTLSSQVGIAVACLGAGLYSILKSVSKKKK
mmetsp:Transcript_2391/g.3415  ORF Transcript_2391/g.3415 Transcript_2391/m.3415 type:complete len:339 (+) Transcript_2391:81-1097(+)